MVSTDFLDFPAELCSKPAALVGLCGLDVQNNALHRTIWEVFRKSHERSPVNFKLFSLNHAFPPVKPKVLDDLRTTHDFYIPKGILKRNWMRKHLLEIPAVVALMFDWDDSNADQLKAECVAQLRAVRASLSSHNSKIVVILIQKVTPLPDDAKASEKARSLCAACEIDTKQLYVLPHGDHLQGYIVRLENALCGLTQSYFHQEIKMIKQRKDQLNKTTQQYLFVRHHFKLGFLSELKQDNHNAAKYYDTAYGYLKDVRISDTNIVEVKLIAGFIIYKLCHLKFRLNQPRDAITCFKLHIEQFKKRTGSASELPFEHYSWLSKQYSAFGDIFDDAVRQGLPAIQTQHPGFYYHLAAKYAVERRKACLEACRDVPAYPASDPLLGLSSLEFYGQRPWRPGQLSAEPLNPALELEGMTALKHRERLVNHSEIIINLLGNAISQFKTYRCPRMRLELVVQMADEYFHSQDYGKALTLFSHILWDYKDEKWWLLLSVLLRKALSCAYMAASAQDYVLFSVEALGPLAKFDLERRKKILSNLMAVLEMRTPEPEGEMPPECVEKAKSLWEAGKLRGEPQSVKVEMNSQKCCIEAKARFAQQVFRAGEVGAVEVLVRSLCPGTVQLSHLSVVIKSGNWSAECAVSSEKQRLELEPGVVRTLLCEFECGASDIGRSIHIEAIVLTIGSSAERCASLRYSAAPESNGAGGQRAADEFEFFRLTAGDLSFDRIESLSVASVVSAESKVRLTVHHDSPALLSEWYPVEIRILNEEEFEVTEVVLEVKLQQGDVSAEQSTQLCVDIKDASLQHFPSSLSLPLGDLPQKEAQSAVFYVRGLRAGGRHFTINLSYALARAEPPPPRAFVRTSLEVPVIQPFEVSAEILSMKFEQIDKCFAQYPFILSPTVRILSPWPISIHQSTLEPGLLVTPCDKSIGSHLAGTVLSEGECGVDMFPLLVKEPSEQPLALGVYLLKWSRANSAEVTSSSVTMPAVTCEPTPIGICMSLPAHGWVRRPMKVEYSLHNHTSSLLLLDLFMEASDAFMFAGQKQVLLRLPPGSVKKLVYNLYPLFSGHVALPRLIFRNPTEDFVEQLNQIMDRNLSSHIYVMPQEKFSVRS